jgi:PBP1b-binding outer membrane lipoprotein LpoB
MRKSFLKNGTSTILTLCLVMLLASCSSDEKDPAVVFTSLDATKTLTFIEEPITLNLTGSGYKDINLTTSNTKIKITKVASLIYEISSTEATSAKIYAELSNNTYKETKNIDLAFVEHGVKNFNTVEGIRVNIDKSSKVLSLLGEPNQKSTSTSGLIEYWTYSSKGVLVAITKGTSVVNNINIYSSNYFILLENGTKLYYTNYPYEIGNGWKINNVNTTMDMVITKLGAATEKISSSDPASTLRTYIFTSQNLYVSFYGNTIDDYTGKTIRSVIIY